LLLPFISGIIVAITSGMPFKPPLFIVPLLIVVFIAFEFLFSKKVSYKYRWLTGFYINILFFILGYLLTFQNTAKFNPQNISHFTENTDEYVFRVSEAVVEKPGSMKVVAMLSRQKSKRIGKRQTAL
jgi:hypothetical protein